MKPRNFPARKLARQLAAQEGGSCKAYVDDPRIEHARSIRTKKRRSNS